MAQRVETILIDDVDGGTADETLEFAFDGATYEIDLSTENAAKLREALSPWAEKARRTSSASKKKKIKGKDVDWTPVRHSSLKEIREWANANGHQVSDRGRVPAHIERAYEEAHRAS